MKRNNTLLTILVVIALLVVGGLSVYAYQKEQSYKNKTPQVTTKTSAQKLEDDLKSAKTKFESENEVNKKIEIFEDTLNKKTKVDNEKKDELTKLFTDTTNKMKEDIRTLVQDKIKEYTLNAQEEQSSEKVDDIDKKLADLRTQLDNKKAILYTDEEIAEVLNQIDLLRSANKLILSQQEAQRQLTGQQTQQEAVVQTPAVQPTAPVQPSNQGTVNNNVVTPTTPSNNNTTTTPTTPANNGTTGGQ